MATYNKLDNIFNSPVYIYRYNYVFILMEKHDNNTILWIMFIFILCGLFIVLRFLLKETERLVDDLKNQKW